MKYSDATYLLAVSEISKADPPTYHRVFDKVYVVLTPQLGALLWLTHPSHDFKIQEGIHAE